METCSSLCGSGASISSGNVPINVQGIAVDATDDAPVNAHMNAPDMGEPNYEALGEVLRSSQEERLKFLNKYKTLNRRAHYAILHPKRKNDLSINKCSRKPNGDVIAAFLPKDVALEGLHCFDKLARYFLDATDNEEGDNDTDNFSEDAGVHKVLKAYVREKTSKTLVKTYSEYFQLELTPMKVPEALINDPSLKAEFEQKFPNKYDREFLVKESAKGFNGYAPKRKRPAATQAKIKKSRGEPSDENIEGADQVQPTANVPAESVQTKASTSSAGSADQGYQDPALPIEADRISSAGNELLAPMAQPTTNAPVEFVQTKASTSSVLADQGHQDGVLPMEADGILSADKDSELFARTSQPRAIGLDLLGHAIVSPSEDDDDEDEEKEEEEDDESDESSNQTSEDEQAVSPLRAGPVYEDPLDAAFVVAYDLEEFAEQVQDYNLRAEFYNQVVPFNGEAIMDPFNVAPFNGEAIMDPFEFALLNGEAIDDNPPNVLPMPDLNHEDWFGNLLAGNGEVFEGVFDSINDLLEGFVEVDVEENEMVDVQIQGQANQPPANDK